MKRLLACILLTIIFSVANIHSSVAMVMFIPVAKGDVPSLVQTPELRQALSTVPPLGGTSTVGSWNNCTLYYRGTQASLQALLDKIDRIENVQIGVSIDPSGKIGKVKSEKFRPLIKPLIYQFSVSVSCLASKQESVFVVIHKSDGIDPSKLRLPKPKAISASPVAPK